MKRKLAMIILAVVCCLSFAFAVGCGGSLDNNDENVDMLNVYNTYVVYAEENGKTPLSYEEWLATIKGETGDKGDKGDQGIQGETGATIEKVEFDDQGRLVITLTDGTVLEPIDVPNLHAHTKSDWVVDEEATCLKAGIKHKECTDCKAILEIESIEQLSHNVANWQIIFESDEDCEKNFYCGVCSICKDVQTRAGRDSDHDWDTEFDFSEEKHWQTCKNCLAVKNEEKHSEGDGCIVCDYIGTQGILYKISDDETFAEVVGYEGVQDKVVIVSRYKGLPVTRIAREAFYQMEELSSIIVPKSVTYIDDYAFGGISTDKVSIPETTEVSSLAFDLKYLPQTQLYVSHFTSGYGSTWIRKMKKDFEAAYANVSFEEGKMGVQIMIDDHVTLGDAMDFHANDNYVFFLDSNDYNNQAIDEKGIMDITDVVKGTFDINNVAGHENTPDVDPSAKEIFSKFNATQKSALNLGTETEPAYYGIPWYEGFYGLTYDAKLFNDRCLYFTKSGYISAREGDENISAGPDNVEGTYDDGLPATYEQFFALCDEMVDLNIVPIIFAGQHQFYITNVINALIADYNGVQKERLNYDFNGTTEIITGWSGNTPQLTPVTITNANGYNIFRQPSYYYGLEFLEELIRGNNYSYWYGESFSEAYPWTDAQSKFLLANLDYAVQDIGMLAEGTWWTAEAAGEFANLSANYANASAMERDLRFMPLPKHSSKATSGARRTTLLESQKSMMYISTETPDKYVPLCKLFLQFCNTQSSIEDFTVLTNTSRALTYELSDASYNKLTPYGKSILDMKNSPYTDVVYQFSTNPLYAYNMSRFKKHMALECFGYSYPSNLLESDSSKTAKDVFSQIANNWEIEWAANFYKYI